MPTTSDYDTVQPIPEATLIRFALKPLALGVIPAIQGVTAWFAYIAFAVIVLGSISSNVLNLYSGAMSSLTWDMPLNRYMSAILVGVIGLILSLAFGGPRFYPFFADFLYVLVYRVTPWLGITAIDFYLFHRRGDDYPDVLGFYKQGGIFGIVRWRGLERPEKTGGFLARTFVPVNRPCSAGGGWLLPAVLPDTAGCTGF